MDKEQERQEKEKRSGVVHGQERTPAPAQAPKEATARKKKKPIRLPMNWFDLVVIAVLIVAGIAVFGNTQLMALLGFGSSAESCTVEYMVMFSDVDEQLALSIGDGNAVYAASSGLSMGTVMADPEVQTHRVVAYVDGSAQMKDKPGTVDIIVTIRAAAEYTEGEGFDVGGVMVRVGDNLSLRFPMYTGVGHCINVSRSTD